MEQKWAVNGGNRLEYLTNGRKTGKLPFVMSMGIWEPAARAGKVLEALDDRLALALSYRGRGGSEAPESGYDWRDHASDLEAVMRAEAIEAAVFLGFSKGVSYLLGYLKQNLHKAKGLILVDFPAIHAAAEKGYADFWDSRVYQGKRLGDFIQRRALEGIESESTYTEFYDLIAAAACPIAVFRGMKAEAAIPSNLTDSDMQRYLQANPGVESVDFTDSGHMLFDDEGEKLLCSIRAFLKGHDL